MKRLWTLALLAAAMAVIGDRGTAAERKPGSNEFFEYCSACHSIHCNRERGPKLGGVIGRKSGSVPGFKDYSDAIKGADIVWTLENIDEFLMRPQNVLPGGGMQNDAKFTKASAEERRKILQFIQDPDHSADLCP